MATAPRNFAAELLDRELDNGWRVTRQLARGPSATGGQFSIGYEVTRTDGVRAFLKAIDFSRAFRPGGDPARLLQAMTEAFNHERELCKTCSVRRMSRIVSYLEDGTVEVDPTQPYSTVQYLIFELASGDVRAQLEVMQQLDNAFVLRTLHAVTVGLKQMHAAGLAHQDLKPSNVLQCGTSAKIADLGRASSQAVVAPHDSLSITGDRGYAPINQLYGETGHGWDARRRATDLYHLGNVAVFLFTKGNITAAMIAELGEFQRPGVWSEGFAQVLPYVRHAFETALEELKLSVSPMILGKEIKSIVRQLCDPEPDRRGHPESRIRHENQFDLQRYVSWFERLAKQAELGFTGGAR